MNIYLSSSQTRKMETIKSRMKWFLVAIINSNKSQSVTICLKFENIFSMVGFKSMQNIGKWLDYSVKNNLETLLFATREFLILLNLNHCYTFTALPPVSLYVFDFIKLLPGYLIFLEGSPVLSPNYDQFEIFYIK